MIERIFTSNSTSKPIILEDCTLYIRLESYPIGTTFIFKQQASHNVAEFGQVYRTNVIYSDKSNTGYFSSENFLDFSLFNSKLSSANVDEIAIFGYQKNIRYIVTGIMFTKQTLGKKFLAKFSFSDYKTSRVKF